MMRLIRWAPLVLYGISASTALAEADISTSPARSDAPLFAASVPLGPDLDTTATSYGLYRPEKRQASTPGSLELTPAHLAELLSELRVVYGQLSIAAETRDTGLLNNLLGVLSGVVPPLSDVIEGVRSILIGDSVTILQQLAAAQALGVRVVTTTQTTTVTVTQPGVAAQLSQCLPGLASGSASLGVSASAPTDSLSDDLGPRATATLPVQSWSVPVAPPITGLPPLSLPGLSTGLPTPSVGGSVPLPGDTISSLPDPSLGLPSLSLPSVSPASVTVTGGSFSTLSVSAGSLPSVQSPTLSVPSLSLPPAQLPSVPNPSLSLPSLSLYLPSLPSLSVPPVSDSQGSSPSALLNVPSSCSRPSVSSPGPGITPSSLAPPNQLPGISVSGASLTLSAGPSATPGGASTNNNSGVPPGIPIPPGTGSLAISTCTTPTLAISLPPASVPSNSIADLLSRLSDAVASQTTLTPNLLSEISNLLTPQPSVPTPVVPLTPVVSNPHGPFSNGAGSQSTGIPDLLAQLSSLLAPPRGGGGSVSTPNPGGISPAVPSIPVQGLLPTRSGGGLPGFLTSIIPAVPPLASTNGQLANLGPLLTQNPTAAAVEVPNPVPSSLFNPRSPDNVAVYFGQPDASKRANLLETCADKNVDIVILGFLTHITFGGGTYPRLQLSPGIPSAQTPAMLRVAPGLSFYGTLEADIKQCQIKYGKKILLSLGGAGNSLPLGSDQDALSFAHNLWELFGPMGKIDPSLRPFGTAVLDGFDLNKQDECAAHFDSLAATLRGHFAVDASKDYFLSAAPSCAFPDVSIHPGYLAQSNFVWPRFFNDSRCEVGSAGFPDSVRQWSHAIGDGIVPMRDSSALRTRLYVGLSAQQKLTATGLFGLTSLVLHIEALVPNGLGGIMVSDGTQGVENVVDGLSLLAWVKAALRALL
ncbi:glycoside hydrolase family 18 protein [Trichocladium antarcticum]|uniref:Glycoside hydrolase family 18 protein n=1 Tax=Trichocladium antarcticum TaxID=1450529 RepID=A0AAN6ZAR1_9PEZI|nr:glycoside hydrolase family 18 protein [Trichocladium antarcticum]